MRNVVNHGTIIRGGAKTPDVYTLPNQTDRARGIGIEMKKGGGEQERKRGREREVFMRHEQSLEFHCSSSPISQRGGDVGLFTHPLIRLFVYSFIHARGVGIGSHDR